MKMIDKCPLTEKRYCKVCNLNWVGWRPAENKEEDEKLWKQFCKDQQTKHEKNWNEQVERMKLV